MEREWENILKLMYRAREEEFGSLNTEDKIFMEKDEANRSKKYYYLKNQINKIPFSLNNIKNNITKCVEDYVESIDYENAYFN